MPEKPVKDLEAMASVKTIGMVMVREWVMVLALIFGGCCSNVYSLELLVKSVPTSGNLITFAQFVFVATEGLYNALELKNGIRLKKRAIPLWNWVVMVVIFWTVSVLNNYALGFNIPMPLHIIFRSASLMISMIVGWTMFGRTFTVQQVVGVICVTVGVILSTIASTTLTFKKFDIFEFFAGIGILLSALILASFLGQYQQITYSKYGRHWREGLFYNHILGLPPFLLFYKDLSNQIALYNASPLVSVKIGILDSIQIPQMWLFLLLNVTTQYICISGVSKLTSMTSSVTVNLVLSIRKFVSLFLSIFLFNNPFTLQNWIGAVCVFVGTMMYVLSNSTQVVSQQQQKKK